MYTQPHNDPELLINFLSVTTAYAVDDTVVITHVGKIRTACYAENAGHKFTMYLH